MAHLRAGSAGIHDSWALPGLPSTRGCGVSPAQPGKEFPCLALASFSTCSLPCHPSSPLHSLWQVSESLNWVMNLGKKSLLLCSLLLYWWVRIWWLPDQLSSAECQGYLKCSNQREWPGAGGEEEDGRRGLGPTPLSGGELLRLLTPNCAALLRYCHNVLPDWKMGRYKSGIFFARQKLTALRGIKEESSPSVLSLNKPAKVNLNGRRMRLILARPSQSKANAPQIALMGFHFWLAHMAWLYWSKQHIL